MFCSVIARIFCCLLLFLTWFDLFSTDKGNHGIIASKRCDHLSVKDNICYDNGGSGIMLHKSCDDSVVSGDLA